jgi:hypothetical protein
MVQEGVQNIWWMTLEQGCPYEHEMGNTDQVGGAGVSTG